MTPEQQQEVERASALFHTALTALGAQSVVDTLSLWQDVPPVPNVSNSRLVQRWLATAVKYVMRRRIRARDMALAYYRYERALTTGKTIALPGQENPPYMTLPQLKREFESFISPDGSTTAETDDAQEASNVVRIPVEKIEGLEDDLNALEQDAEEQVRDNLLVLGPLNQDRKTRTARYVEPEQVDEGRADAHTKAGRRQAAAAERNVLNGARGPLYLAAQRDKRAIGYVRVSKTGTPCGFCAMLISRGVVYKSEKTAGDQDLWHDNCHCIAIPVFSMRQYESNDLFALNREYDALWKKFIKGKYSGDRALSEWRRLIRERAKSQKSLEAAA
jgi:hypothetical protein